MSVSDYTTLGEIPVENKNSQNTDEEKESYAKYHLYVKKYPIFLIILSLLAFVFGIVAVCYVLFIPMEKRHVISGVFIFSSITIIALCYLIDMYLEYKSWSLFGEQVHNTNVKAWDGEYLEYPELNKFDHSLTKIVLPSCALLGVGGILLLLFSSPMESENDGSINETETTTITVPNEDEEVSNINPAPPVVNNNSPVIIDDNPQNDMNSHVSPETTISSEENLETLQSDQPSIDEKDNSSKNNNITSQRETLKNENTVDINPNDNNSETQGENDSSNNQTVENHLPEENNSTQPKYNNKNNDASDNNVHPSNPAPVVNTESTIVGQNNE